MNDWLNILQGASFVGLLIVSTIAGLQRSQVQSLKESVGGLRGDRDDLNARLERRDADLNAANNKIAELTSAVNVLRATVTGEAHLVAIEDVAEHINTSLTKHHEEAMERLDRLDATLAELLRRK